MSERYPGDASGGVRDRFAVNLYEARFAAGLSQLQLAERCGMHRTEVSLLERGGREPRLGTIIRLAGALEVAPSVLCGNMAWKEHAQRFEFE
ncbi:MAG: helix-turn-helix transcriptional regulator [Solirubrobacterales bacterium]